MDSPSPFPPGVMRSIVLHWTAGDYTTAFDAYHFCVALRSGGPVVLRSAGLETNMRDVRGSGAPYAAHTSGRNSFAVGLAICAMAQATPSDFGRFALRDEQLDAACNLAAQLCTHYAIAVDAQSVLTHAEAAIADGYFGCAEDERWDIARLRPSTAPLDASEARDVGDELRSRIRAKLIHAAS